ncbi:MAG: DNA topoisomerase IV subunit A [Spirochaetales bacterium]|nr:DNA topoisomerase IV subunit A [Spirochaetales bacterium]
MAYVKNVFDINFLEYASYVIKDRAIPDIADGLKPVQRRILHSLFEMDDGKFHKVANVVGHCMKYHPHGDMSIYSALVVLAEKNFFIDKQGNFGNIFTGDSASAARYIECRLLPLAKEVLLNPDITVYEDSYDGRNREPVAYPAKIPVVLLLGTEGIAVGMSTKILPHNFNEVLDALSDALNGKKRLLYPDFPTGGILDVSGYDDGNGKVLVRAKLDTKDPKRVVIRELPFGQTSESIIASIEAAVRKNKLKVASISDFTTDKVEIEIKLPRGIMTEDVVDALYAFTDCETSISVNLLVIKDKKPVQMTVTEVINYYALQLVDVLTRELKLEEKNLKARLHAKTLEQIFIEERIYKKIEQMKTSESVIKAVITGFEPFLHLIKNEVTEEDVERLLKIPIRRISLYDINRAKKEMEEILARLKEIKYHLAHIKEYALSFISGVKAKYGAAFNRNTQITSFQKVDMREAAIRSLKLRYDKDTGYLGYEVASGTALFDVSIYDRVLIIKKNGTYLVMNVPDRVFIDKGMLHCAIAEKEQMPDTVFTILYKTTDNKAFYIKRCRIEKYILDKAYDLVPDNAKLIYLTTREEGSINLVYAPKARVKILEESFDISSYLIKGVKAGGVRLTTREVKSCKFVSSKKKTQKNGK